MATNAKQQVVVQSAPLVRTEVMTADGRRPYVTKYSPETHAKIVELTKKGHSQTDTGLLAGLGRDTLATWLYNGRHEPEKYPHFALLNADCERAKAERRAQAVENIVEVGDSKQAGTWQANAWFLERTDPENWGRKDKVEHVGNDAPRTQVNTVVLIDSDARETARDLLRRVAGHASPDVTIGPGGGMQLEDGDA